MKRLLLLLLLLPALAAAQNTGDSSSNPLLNDYKVNVRAATTANITIATDLNAGDTLDGLTLAANDRVLVKDQTTSSQNGIYVVAAAPYRANDANAWAEMPGSIVYVTAGTVNAGRIYANTSAATGTVGTTAITYGSPRGSIGGGGLTASPVWVTVTADASSETFTTASVHGYSAGDAVIFATTNALPTLQNTDYFEDTTYGPITTLVAGRLYYVATAPTTTTFTLYYYATGGPVTISDAGTGTHSVNLAARQNLVLAVDKDGAIQAQAYDSTENGGNQRGKYALDLQRARENANQVAETNYSTILNGENNRITSTGLSGSVYGKATTIASGYNNSVTNLNAGLVGGRNNIITGTALALVYGERMQVDSGSSDALIALGSQHFGGGQATFLGGGFHNYPNYGGYSTTTSLNAGTVYTGGGGINMQIFGAGTHGYWQGCEFRSNHANKDKAMIRGNLICQSTSHLLTIANGTSRTDELYLMGYYPDYVCDQSSGVNTGTDVFTVTVNVAATALADNLPVRLWSTDALPTLSSGTLNADTTYYLRAVSGSTFKLSTTASDVGLLDITGAGTGILSLTDTWVTTSVAPRWCRFWPNNVYTFDFTIVSTLLSATTPTYAVWKRRAAWIQGAALAEPTLIGAVETVGTDVGSNAGAPPAGWSPNLTVSTDGLHVSVTIQNNDGTARGHHTTAAFEAVQVQTQ